MGGVEWGLWDTKLLDGAVPAQLGQARGLGPRPCWVPSLPGISPPKDSVSSLKMPVILRPGGHVTLGL